ncbi:MAG TPA: hypothetical protein VD866_18385 [Urbifossiella sp.]|nr:hypothetical protein [Urbifossiella sp.]
MNRPFVLGCAVLAGVLAAAPAAAQQRALFYPAEPAGRLKDAADAVRDLKRPAVPYADLSASTEYYARVVPRRVVLDDKNQLKAGAVLGGKPFVFLTTPQGLTGRSLLDILLDTGHEPAEILASPRGEAMVALVFKYPPAVAVSAARDGTLPADWARAVYVPTWENAFALFGKLAEGATIDPAAGSFQPVRLTFTSEAQRAFVLNYPRAGRDRIKDARAPYDVLRRVGGADWEYRRLLEDKFSAFAHFRGTGRAVNVVRDPDMARPDSGVLEFVGPNSSLSDLPELAVVDLGRLTIADTYTPPAP